MGNIGPTPTGNIFLDTIDQTIDPNLPPPTSQIRGSSSGVTDTDGVGVPNVPTNEEIGDALFPFFDGTTEKLATNPVSQTGLTEYRFPGRDPTMTPAVDANGNPLDQQQLFENSIPMPGPADLPVEDFFGFHSAHQLEYIDLFGTPLPNPPGGKQVLFESDGNQFNVVSSPDGRRVFTLQQLTKADLAITSLEDQQALSNAMDTLDPLVKVQIESAIGAQAGVAARTAFDQSIERAKADIDALFVLNDDLANNPISATDVEAAKAVYIDQIRNIETRGAGSAFLSQAEINTRIGEIVRRAERANEFFIVVQNPAALVTFESGTTIDNPFGGTIDIEGQSYDAITNLNSLSDEDGSQSGLRSGFDAFIAQETRIRDLDNQRLQLSQTGLLNGGRTLDGPNLIAIFQLNYNLVREAEVNVETEELTQQNALLRDYARVQQLVNNALRTFSSGEDGASEERTLSGRQNSNVRFDSLSTTDQNTIAFIEDLLIAPLEIKNPIESLRGIERPTLDAISNSRGTLNRFSQNELNIYASQLADTVTQINQESQILTNEISNLNRERNRHFDLANNALRRLNDSLQTIARI